MTILEYQDQSAEALRLNLVQGAVDKELLTVLCTGHVETSYGRVEAGIIGASHYFEFTRPNQEVVFTEVFACTSLDVGERVHYGDLMDSSSIRKHFSDLTYNFRARKLNWDQGEKEYEELCELVTSNSDQFQFGLQFSFPNTEDLRFPPVTLVYVQTDPKTLSVQARTLHAYPNDGSLVFTETKVQPR